MVTVEATEASIVKFLKRFSGTHKLSELQRMFGPTTRDALDSLLQQKKIEFFVDEDDSRFTGYRIETIRASEGTAPQIEKGSLPSRILEFLANGPKTKQQIIDKFKSEKPIASIRGRLSEMNKSGQVIKNGAFYKAVKRIAN
jgi:hypothetical protein